MKGDFKNRSFFIKKVKNKKGNRGKMSNTYEYGVEVGFNGEM